MKMKYKLTACRYSGGKSTLVRKMEPYLIKDFKEYREPFLGGGSVFFHMKQYQPNASFWLNDKYFNLICFWTTIRDNPKQLRDELYKAKTNNNTIELGRDLFLKSKAEIENGDMFWRAYHWYIINKCGYGGLSECRSGYSPQAFERNFTLSGINYLEEVSHYFKGVKITNLDYSELLEYKKDLYIFLDPPYDILTKKGTNALYGKDGEMHTSFDHLRFAEDVKKCKSNWLITYNHSPTLIERFKDYRQATLNATYTMTWGKDDKGDNYAKVKKELLIMNYGEITLDDIFE